MSSSLNLDVLLDRERTVPGVPPTGPFDAWRLRDLSPSEFAALGDRGDGLNELQLAYIACFGLLAPTSHNTVPQRFRLDQAGRAIEVWLDRGAVLPASDPTGRQAAVSIGCVVAHLVLGARSLDLEARVELLPLDARETRPLVDGDERNVAVARVSFQASPRTPPERWIDAMLERKVVRAEYDERVKLEAPAIEEMRAIASTHPGIELHLITDAPTLLFLGKFQEIADTTVFNRDAFALELGQWLLPNDAEVPVGMRGREFGLTDVAALRIHRGLQRLQPLLPDEVAGFAKAGNIGMRSSAAVAVLTVDEDSVARRIAAGWCYEELTLSLTRRRFCTAMHAGITEVEAPNLALRGRLRTTRRPTVVFRIGQPLAVEDRNRPHSARPMLRDVLLARDAT